MRSLRVGFIVAGLFALVVVGGPGIARQGKAEQEKKEADVVITSPKEGGKVGQTEDVEGKLNVEGWPVVFVRPPGDQPWWVQAPVEDVTDRKFTTRGQFGNEQTKPGTKFRIVIVVCASKEAAHKFERGMTRDSLPPGLKKSESVTVTRE